MLLLLFLMGLGFLIVGAEILVRGASRLAEAIGISPLVIGLTVVAFGTSSPEFAVGIKAALAGQANIAVGNVVGSNIFNILFTLGLAALITPLLVAQQLVRIDVPLLILSSVAVLVMGLDLTLNRLDGLLLFIGLIAYVIFLVVKSKGESRAVKLEYAQEYASKEPVTPFLWLLNGAFIVVGLAMLIFGSRWLVNSAVAMAQALGVSELIIGLTIIAIGTSLPEVVTSVIAGLKGERDIAVGNAVGSSLFNILGVLGLSALVAPSGIALSAKVLSFDLLVMTATAALCFPIFFLGNNIARWEGGILLGYYFAYTLYLILEASRFAGLPLFNRIMLYGIIPITLIGFTLGIARERLYQNKA